MIHDHASVAVRQQAVPVRLEGIEVGGAERDVVRPVRQAEAGRQVGAEVTQRLVVELEHREHRPVAGVVERVAGPAAPGRLEHVDLGEREPDRLGVEAVGRRQVLRGDGQM